MVEKTESSENVSPVEIIWGLGRRKSFSDQKSYSLLMPSEKLKSDSASMTSSSPQKIPLPSLPAAAASAPNLNVPLKKTFFLLLTLSLMILGLLFFLGGFFFHRWISSTGKDHGLSHQTVKNSLEKKIFSNSEDLQKVLAGTLSTVPALLGKKGDAYKELAPIISEVLKKNLGKEINPKDLAPLVSEVLKKNLEKKGTKEEISKETSETLDASDVTYGVQLGTFVTEENALDLIKKLEEKKIAAHIKVEKDKTGEKLFSVLTKNEFSTYDAAESSAQSLFKQESISAFAVAIEPVAAEK
jgi:hypothetical protein